MTDRPYVIDSLISAKQIAARIETLSREIEAEFAGTSKLVVVGLLRGSFVFIADLVRELDLPIEVDFLEASSYGDGMESSGEVGKVNISQATYELLKDDPQFDFESRGKIQAKGKGEMEMWFVEKG